MRTMVAAAITKVRYSSGADIERERELWSSEEMRQAYWALFGLSVPWTLLLILYAWMSSLYTVGGATQNNWIVYTHVVMALIAIGSLLVARAFKRKSRIMSAIALMIASPVVIVGIELWAASRV